ncbi:MAG: FAD-dependent oxidoreductase [archaeon]|nr:FAD-dependent oxidoreductase [archaeon]
MKNKNSKDKKIAIIGAGISGLTTAYTLKKSGYNNITIYEGLDRIGGKIHSIEKDGNVYELGAVFTLDSYKTVPPLAKEYNIKLVKQCKTTFYYYKGEQVPPVKLLRDNYSLVDIAKCMFRFIKLIKKYKSLKAVGLTNVDPELFNNFLNFLKKNKLEPFIPVLEPMTFAYCYGHIDTTPSLYFIKLLLCGISLLFKDQLNSTFGLKLGIVKTFEKGYQNLLKEMAKDFDIRLNSKITKVTRDKSGESYSIQVTANNETHSYDRIIISSLPNHTMEYLDLTKDENEIFSRVKTYNYQSFLFKGEVHLKEAALFFDTSYITKSKGFPACICNMYPENNIFQTYQLNDGNLSKEELEAKVREAVNMLGGRINEIVASGNYTYFPHFLEKDLIELQPYERLEKLQGKNGTYFTGSLFNVEAAENSAEYSQYLMNKHF